MPTLVALPGGKLASCSLDDKVRVWKHGVCLLVLKGHAGWVNTIVGLVDGTLASASDDKTVRVWDTSSGECLRVLSEDIHTLTTLAPMPDGRLVSSGRLLCVWE
jgi:WD40 repeat protein